MPFDLANWESQTRKGLLEFVLLALLARGERYGYELVREAQQVLSQRIVEGTVYPLLGRLAREGLIGSRWSFDAGTQPRKYYLLSAEGATALAGMRTRLAATTRGLLSLLEET